MAAPSLSITRAVARVVLEESAASAELAESAEWVVSVE
jgi:hypothetical protein